MLVVVGSRNHAKIKAVESAFRRFFKDINVKGVEVESGVKAQPLSLEEIVLGAINRAKAAWEKAGGKCDYSAGTEAGLFPVPYTSTGYMDMTANAVFDGKRIYLGLGPCFEYPKEVVEKILGKGKEVSEVFLERYSEDMRDEQGAIGRLSLGKMPRHVLQETGLIMALMQAANKKYYG